MRRYVRPTDRLDWALAYNWATEKLGDAATDWNNCDLKPKEFINPPQRLEGLPSLECTPFGLFNLFFDDVVIDFIVEKPTYMQKEIRG